MRFLTALLFLLATTVASADTTITYQGQLQDASGPVDATVDMSFALFDAETDGDQVGTTINLTDVSVVDGLFQVNLDFGDVFGGGPLFLEIVTNEKLLEPRQPLRPAPLAIHALGISEQTLAKLDCADGQIVRSDGSSWSCGTEQDTTYGAGIGLVLSGSTFALDVDETDNRYWRQGGNAGTDSAADFLGTSDDVAFEIHVNARRAFRIESGILPNLIGGHPDNRVEDGVRGATIAGGGGAESQDRNNIISANHGTIGGGGDNRVGGQSGTVPGGFRNQANGTSSFAAGNRAIANHTGTFVWSDSSDLNSTFSSAKRDTFLIQAEGGVGINTNSPSGAMEVVGGNTIVGGWDHDDRLGVGTNNPWNTLHVVSNEDQGPLRVMVNDNSNSSTSIRAYGHQGVAIGNGWSRSSVPARGLRVHGDAVKSGGGQWSSPSDRRLKKAIEPLQSTGGVLEQLLALQGVQFEFTPSAIDDGLGIAGKQFGFIAQQVGEVFPEWVDENGDGYLYITQRGTTALMVEAMRELRDGQHSELTELRAEIAVLKSQAEQMRDLAERNAELETRLATLEALLLEDRQVAEQSQ